MPKINYSEYINSEKWTKRRKKFLQSEHSNYLNENKHCAACETVEGKYNVHHKRYSRLGREHNKDLVRLCEICHKSLHKFYKEWVVGCTLFKFTDDFIDFARTWRLMGSEEMVAYCRREKNKSFWEGVKSCLFWQFLVVVVLVFLIISH